MHPNVSFGIKVLREAGKKMARYFDESVMFHSQSQRGYFRTLNEFIEESSAKLHQTMQKTFPDSMIVEMNTALGMDLREIHQDVWVYQIINGIENFSNNIPFFCMTLMNLRGHVPQHAIIYDPIRDEDYSASKGYGAQLNNRRLRVNPTHDHSLYYIHESLQGLAQAKQRNLGCLSLELCFVAANRGNCVILPHNLDKLDIAAAKLIAREAGAGCFSGVIADLKTPHAVICHLDTLKKSNLFSPVLSYSNERNE